MKEVAWSIEAKHPVLYEGLLWLASVVEPRDYLTSARCRDGHALTIKRFTLFSNWEEWGIEDRVLTPIQQEDIDAFLEGLKTNKSPQNRDDTGNP